MLEVKEYCHATGQSPFRKWFDGLNAEAAAKVTTAVERIRQGHSSSVKGVGDGVFEYKIDFGPGYRIYFGKDGEKAVILLGGGTKKRQTLDIASAAVNWRDYKDRKKQGEK